MLVSAMCRTCKTAMECGRQLVEVEKPSGARVGGNEHVRGLDGQRKAKIDHGLR